MELAEAIRRRAMCRRFLPVPVEPPVVEGLLLGALRSPTAGNTGGTSWVVLTGPDQTSRYWQTTTDELWRARHPDWADGLMRAPVVLLAYTSPAAYVRRYGEADKSDRDLSQGPERWPVPYWYGDAAFGVMTVLLGAVEAGLGACLLGSFRGEAALAATLEVPSDWRLFGAVVLGRPDERSHRSSSLRRSGSAPADRIHHGRW